MKKTLHFDTRIHASPEKVWDTLLEQDTYRDWTSVFMEGSYYEGSWGKGDRIRFLAPDGRGMVSEIAENRPNEFLSIRHIGVIKDGVDDTTSAEAVRWAPAFENYTLKRAEGTTEVDVDVDVTPEYEKFMNDAWPKALLRLKAICEEKRVN